jgi:hypothetical protein
LSRLVVPRMLATGSVVSAATAVRAGSRCAFAVATRTPALVALSVRSVGGSGPAQWAFRDELLGLVRDTAELSWREVRRGIDELDVRTRPAGGGPARPYRVKV